MVGLAIFNSILLPINFPLYIWKRYYWRDTSYTYVTPHSIADIITTLHHTHPITYPFHTRIHAPLYPTPTYALTQMRCPPLLRANFIFLPTRCPDYLEFSPTSRTSKRQNLVKENHLSSCWNMTVSFFKPYCPIPVFPVLSLS